MRACDKRALLLSASALALVACGPSLPAEQPPDLVLPAPGGAARAGIPPSDALGELAALEAPASPGGGEPDEVAGGASEAGSADRSGEGSAEVAAPVEAARRLPWRGVEVAPSRYEVPSDWEDLDPATLGSPLIVAAQRAPAPKGGFMTNANLAAEPWDPADAASWGPSNVASLGRVAIVEDTRTLLLGSTEVLDVEASWDNPGGVPYRTLQRFVAAGGLGVVVTCAAAATHFEEERETCEAVLDSLSVE